MMYKPFDITKHKLSDCDAWIEEEYPPTQESLTLRIDNHGIELNKDDVIAIAKHFGLMLDPQVSGEVKELINAKVMEIDQREAYLKSGLAHCNKAFEKEIMKAITKKRKSLLR